MSANWLGKKKKNLMELGQKRKEGGGKKKKSTISARQKLIAAWIRLNR